MRLNSSDQVSIYSRQVALRFTTPEIESIYELDRDENLSVNEFNELLRAKELDPLPSIDQELNDSIVKQKTPEEEWLRERKTRNQQRRQAQE